jgi:signal transduction histidine kinase
MNYCTFFFVFLSIICFNNVAAQSTAQIDSLQAACDAYTQEDTKKIKMLGRLSGIYAYSNPKKGIQMADQGIALAKKLGLTNNIIARLLNEKGTNFMSMSEYESAIECFTEALVINQRLKVDYDLSSNYQNIGSCYSFMGNYVKALDFQQRSLTINEKYSDKEAISASFINIGNIYNYLKEYDKAMEYFTKGEMVATEIGNKYNLFSALYNIGAIFIRQHKYEAGVPYYEKSLLICREIGNASGEAYCNLNLGIIYSNLNKPAETGAYLQKCIEYATTTSDDVLLAKALSEMTNIEPFYRLKTPASADKVPEYWSDDLALLTTVLRLFQKTKSLEDEETTWNKMSTYYEKKGDFPKAYEAFKNYVAIRDSSNGDEIKKQITRKEIQYEFDKKETQLKFEQQLTAEQLEKEKLLTIQQRLDLSIKDQALTISNKEKDLQRLAYLQEKAEKQEKEQLLSLAEKDKQLQAADIATLAKEKALQIQTLARQNALIGLLLAGLAALLLAALSFYLWQRQKLAKKEAVSQQQFTQQLFENTEEERGRIARDLHDSVSHELLSLKRSMTAQNNDAAQKIDHIIDDIRQISRNLHPVMLESIGLKLSLETLCEQYMEHEQLFIAHEIDYHKQLTPRMELQIFRIVQEALTNTIKYAGANAAKLTIRTPEKDALRIEIEDNGKGFNVEKTLNSGKSFGLNSILQRSKAIGAAAKIVSTEKGTLITVQI